MATPIKVQTRCHRMSLRGIVPGIRFIILTRNYMPWEFILYRKVPKALIQNKNPVNIINSQAFWILITGFHRMIHYLLVFFTVESYLVLPSYISLTPYSSSLRIDVRGVAPRTFVHQLTSILDGRTLSASQALPLPLQPLGAFLG